MIEKNDPRLTAYVLGELPDDEKAQIESAIETSPELQSAVKELEATTLAITTAFDNEPVVTEASEKVSLANAKPVMSKPNSSVQTVRWIAACSIMLLIGSISYLLLHEENRITLVETKPIEISDSINSSIDNVTGPFADIEVSEEEFEPLTELIRKTITPNEIEDSENVKAFAPNLSLIVGEESGVGGDDQNYQGYVEAETQIIDSLAMHNHRTRDLINSVDTFTYDGESATQRTTDEELIEQLLDESTAASDYLMAFDRRVLDGQKARLRVPLQTDESGKHRERIEQQIRNAIAARHGGNSDELKRLQQIYPDNIVFEEDEDLDTRLAEILAKYSKTNGKRKLEPNSSIRSSFQFDQQISNAKIQLKNALQRLGPSHPSVKALRAQIEMLEQFQQNHEKPPRNWRRVKATNNSTRLLVGDKDELDLTGMQVHVQVDGFRARVLMDYFFYNDRDQQLEGNFKIRLPDDASLYYLAFGQSAYDFSPNGPMAGGEFVESKDQYVSLLPVDIGLARQDAWKNVKEARMVPREKAAFAYKQTFRRKIDPALAEWSGAGVFNARVFPLMPRKLHRIVIGYDVNLTTVDNGLTYRLDLPDRTGQCRVDLNVTDFANGQWQMSFDKPAKGANSTDGEKLNSTEWKAQKVAGNGKSHKRMRFDDPEWKSMTLTARNPKPILLASSADEKGPFFATQIVADLTAEKQSANRSAVFMVDTSLSSQPEKFNIWLDLLKETLNQNRDDLKHFAVLFFDVETRFWKSKYVENTKANVKSLMHDCFQIGLEGATNLHGAMQELADAKWLLENDNRPDVFLLSDGATNWGESNLRLIQKEFVDAGMGSLFAYQTGLNGTAISNLRLLANTTGGAVFSVASNDEIAKAATAHRNRPWRLNAIQMDGASDVMTAGRAQWVYPGQSLTIVGRGKPGEPIGKITLKVSQNDKNQSIPITISDSIESEMAGRLFGQVAVGQLESLGDTVFDISTAYARHFRITGQTCSLLMLESEADYERFNIKPKEDWFVVQSKNASELVEKELQLNATKLADPKSQFIGWLKRMEAMPGLEFKMPTALKIALDDIKINAIDSRLVCELMDRSDWDKGYAEALGLDALDATAISKEFARRIEISPDNALKAYSNLIEANPGNWVIARDVAFKAMELNRPALAYHLLRSVIRRRPYDSSTYSAIAQCLGQLGQTDMAIVFYEIALEANFENQGADFKKIVATDYLSLLRRIGQRKLDCSIPEFVNARLNSLAKYQPAKDSDLVITMMWNTDQTDVDLHVVEPSGEECSYENPTTKSGGKITADIRNGFGPEMYVMPKAANGQYTVRVKYFGSDQSRTSVANKVYLTIYQNFGSAGETVVRETVELEKVGQKELVKTILVEK